MELIVIWYTAIAAIVAIGFAGQCKKILSWHPSKKKVIIAYVLMSMFWLIAIPLALIFGRDEHRA